MKLPAYVVITPARNEADFIELTIKSMVAQTIPPLKWVIVSDGSTDGTDDIVKRYAIEYPWIELLRMPERRERNFAGKVYAFNAGYAKVQGLPYDVVASLDGDISFDPEYFSFLLTQLAENPELGLVGTPFKEASNPIYDYRFVNIEHVSGACQVFRRECFEQIGGYMPVKGGCIDNIAVIMARMRGWKTRTFTDKFCHHHREMGTAQQRSLALKFKFGVKDYTIGNHPLWEIFRGVRQMTQQPFVLGGMTILAGYFWSLASGAERPVSRELMKFYRREQMQRLKRFFRRDQVAAKQELKQSGKYA